MTSNRFKSAPVVSLITSGWKFALCGLTVVVLLFALLFVGTTLFFTVFPTFPLLLLDLLFLILLVPYIRHYYLLENGTQRLYRLQDKLWQRIIEERKKSHP